MNDRRRAYLRRLPPRERRAQRLLDLDLDEAIQAGNPDVPIRWIREQASKLCLIDAGLAEQFLSAHLPEAENDQSGPSEAEMALAEARACAKNARGDVQEPTSRSQTTPRTSGRSDASESNLARPGSRVDNDQRKRQDSATQEPEADADGWMA